MRDRVLADGFLHDLARRTGAPFTDARCAAASIGVDLVTANLPAGLDALASDAAVFVRAPAHAAVGLAQCLLLRAGVGHGDGDVTALAGVLLDTQG